MSAILDYVDAVLMGIARLMPEGTPVEPVFEPLGIEELKKRVRRLPAVLVFAQAATGDVVEGGSLVVSTVAMSAYVAVPSRLPGVRAGASWELVERLLRRVKLSDWGFAEARTPQQVNARVIASEALDQQSLTLWEVSWQQPISLADDPLEQADFYLGAVDIVPAFKEVADV